MTLKIFEKSPLCIGSNLFSAPLYNLCDALSLVFKCFIFLFNELSFLFDALPSSDSASITAACRVVAFPAVSIICLT